MTSVLRTSNVSKRYGRKLSLDDVSLEVPQGSIFGLVGPNGAGKTTTIKILMNLLQPTSGRAEVLGKDTRHLGPHEFADIGYVSENQKMPGWMTVEQLLTYLRPFYPTWDVKLENSLLAEFNLPRDRKLKHLSRGMWMKAALASSLAYRPKLLVLDEPFGGLDAVVRDDFIRGILGHAGEITILLSSHDLSETESFATHIALLDDGRLRFVEEMDTLVNRFRQVEVAFESTAAIPDKTRWPREWLLPEASQALLRFVDTHFDEQRTRAEIYRQFAGVRNISAYPMPLRSIFVAIARGRTV